MSGLTLPPQVTKTPIKRKLKVHSIETKYKALLDVECQAFPKCVVAAKYGVPANTLSNWIKNTEAIKKAYETSSFAPKTKRMRTSKFQELEAAVDLWFKEIRAQNIPISGPILMAKADQLAEKMGTTEFKANVGWLNRFKGRHGYSFKTISGEANAVDTDVIDEWMTGSLLTILEEYQPENIFNADETALFYKLQPNKSLTLQGEDCHGGKRSKERLTILPCSNMTRTEKLPLLVIGKSAKPRCFTGVKTLPCGYRNNKTAWMTSYLFTEWIKQQDKKFAKQKRKVAMVIDNCRAHPNVPDLKAIKLIYLPPNTTSKTQPMDQGIIQALKCNYKKLFVKDGLLVAFEKKKEFTWSVLNAMMTITEAWNKVKPVTIANCFNHCGFTTPTEEEDDDDDDDIPLSVLAAKLRDQGMEVASTDLEAWTHIDDDVTTSAQLTDEDIIAEVQARASTEEAEEEEPDVEPELMPTRAAQQEALRVMRTALLLSTGSEEALGHLNALKIHLDKKAVKELKQTTILDLFTKK